MLPGYGIHIAPSALRRFNPIVEGAVFNPIQNGLKRHVHVHEKYWQRLYTNVYTCSYIQFVVHSSMLIVRVGLIQLAS